MLPVPSFDGFFTCFLLNSGANTWMIPKVGGALLLLPSHNWLKVSVVLKHNRNSSVFVLINRLTQAGVFCKLERMKTNDRQLSPGGGRLARHQLKSSLVKSSLVCFLFCFLRVSRVLNIPVGVRSFHPVKIWAAKGRKFRDFGSLKLIKFSAVKMTTFR